MEKTRIEKVLGGRLYQAVKLVGAAGLPHWEVRGGSEVYLVHENNGRKRCTCPAFRFNGTCKHCDLVPTSIKRLPLSAAQGIADMLVRTIDDYCERIEVCGSIRRKKLDVKDIDIVVLLKTGTLADLIPAIEKHGTWHTAKCGKILLSGTFCGVPVDFTNAQDPVCWPFATLYRTGSRENNIRMRGKAKAFGWTLNERGLWRGNAQDECPVAWCVDEREIFSLLDMDYLPPEHRNY